MTTVSKDMIDDKDVNARLQDGLPDWRKLAQGLHARFVTSGLASGAQLVAAIATADADMGAHLRVTLGDGHVDLRLVSDDAIYRDDDGAERVVQWVTQRDLDLAARISRIASGLDVPSDPASVTAIEIALDTADAARISPMWAALLTGSADARGSGSLGGDVRDATGRVPVLWFQDTDPHAAPRQRFHLDVWVGPECAEERIAAAVAAGATVVDDRFAPSYTVLADADGNRACVCTSSRSSG